jgi:polyisoprenoid-binding protein YceI
MREAMMDRSSKVSEFTRALALGILAVGLLQAQTLTYQLAPGDGSRFALEVYKTGLMSGKKHVFVFEHFGGEAVFDPRRPAEAKVRFAVEAGSVVCTDTWINDGSRRKVQDTARNQMMQADRFPQLSFVSSKAVPLGKEQYDVEGMLTIRDRTRPVLVHITVKDGVFEGSAPVRLSDFGLKPPKGVTLGLIGTRDEMAVLFKLVGKIGTPPAP